MSLHIVGATMTSDTTSHHADEQEPGVWTVSWLPERRLDRNAAITAMSIADMVAATDRAELDDHLIATWAAELDMTGQDAIRQAAPKDGGSA